MGSHADRVDRFRLLYDAVYPRILSYTLRRARTREDAFDAVSETFTTVWRRFDDLPDEPARTAWVFGVARRVLANQYRSLDRKDRLVAAVPATIPTADPEFDLVHQALDQLRPDDREILTLSAWDDLDNDEIALVLAITPSAVAVRLHRARQRLATELSRAGMRIEKSVKSASRIRTPDEVQGTKPGPGEVDRT